MVPNVCSTWEPLQALASCTSLQWSVAASAQQGICKNLNSFWVSQAANPARSTQSQFSTAGLCWLLTCCSCSLGSPREETQGLASAVAQASSPLSPAVVFEWQQLRAVSCPQGPFGRWWRSCSSQPRVLAGLEYTGNAPHRGAASLLGRCFIIKNSGI